MCHWRRPDYSKNSVEHLARCVGIRDYTIIAHIDGAGDPKVVESVEWLRSHVSRMAIRTHQHHLGCNGNTYAALDEGFKTSDYVIHVEDDVLLAKDALAFFEWAVQFKNDKRIFTVSSWRHHNGWLPSQGRKWIPGHERWVALIQWFNVWGWATWKDRWEEMRSKWTKGNDQYASWDTILTTNVRGARHCLCPLISRSNNIGQRLGTHRGQSWIEHWAESPGFVYPGRFERIEKVTP